VCETIYRRVIYVLNQAFKLLKDKDGAIYMDSKYAFGVIHTFGKIWTESRLMNRRGKDFVHKELIVQILDNLMLPEEITIVHVPGHQKGGNQTVDEAAKEAVIQVEVPIFNLTPVLPPPPTRPKFSAEEEKHLIKLGAIKDREGGRGEVAQTMHTHVGKCKNDKIK
jgi:hypothetical protein